MDNGTRRSWCVHEDGRGAERAQGTAAYSPPCEERSALFALDDEGAPSRLLSALECADGSLDGSTMFGALAYQCGQCHAQALTSPPWLPLRLEAANTGSGGQERLAEDLDVAEAEEEAEREAVDTTSVSTIPMVNVQSLVRCMLHARAMVWTD